VAPLTKNTVHVKVKQVRTTALVDTGASISCVGMSYLKKLGIAANTLKPADIAEIVGVGGETHPVLGSITLDINIGNVILSQSFHVFSHIHHPMILGMDFLDQNNATIDLLNKRLLIHEDLISVSLAATNAGYVRAKKPVVIPPLSQADIPVHISRCQPGQILLLEPVDRLSQLHIQGAKCLVTNTKRVCMRMLNPGDTPIYLNSKQVIASASEVDTKHIFTLPDQPEPATNSRSHVHSASTSSPRSKPSDLSFDLSDSDLTDIQKQQLHSFLLSQRSAFAQDWSELGKTPLHHHKIDTGNARPVRLPFYRQNVNIRQECSRQVKEMLEHNIIQPSMSEWHSPVVMVKKKDNSYRFAVDYRRLNAVTKSIFFPLPRFEDVVDAVGSSHAQLFSVLDCASGFWQIPLHPETKHKSAFITPEGVFEWNRLPFGLKNAPMAFQRTMAQALKEMNWRYILIYVDDIIVFSKTFEEHLIHLECVFQKIKEAGLTLKPSKCRFAAKKVTYLGHIFSKDGIEVDMAKVDAVNQVPKPNTVREVRHFLGMATYYRKFVHNFSGIASPLHNLLQKDTPFHWSDKCQQAFVTLKLALTSAPILTYPDPTKPFILTTDASMTSLGYILGQRDDKGREHVICYGGRSVHQAEKNWGVTQLECLAVLEGIRAFRVYLAVGKFTVYTDHQALTSLKTIKSDSGRLARWSIMLQEYDFDIIHRRGKANTNADAISRTTFPPLLSEPVTDDIPSPPIPGIPPPLHPPTKRTYAQVASTTIHPSVTHSATPTYRARHTVNSTGPMLSDTRSTSSSIHDAHSSTHAHDASTRRQVTQASNQCHSADTIDTNLDLLPGVADSQRSNHVFSITSDSNYSEVSATDVNLPESDLVSLQVDFVYDEPSRLRGPYVCPVDTGGDVDTDVNDKHLADNQYKSPDLKLIIDYLSSGKIPPDFTGQGSPRAYL